MRQLCDSHKVHAFFAHVLGLHWSDDFRGVLYVPEGAAEEPDNVAIGVGYNCFVGRTCCMHAVIRNPSAVTRTVLRDTFTFPFVACHCEAVLALVDSNNAAALSFDHKLGFRHIASIPNGGPEGALMVLQMLKTECRWLPHNVH